MTTAIKPNPITCPVEMDARDEEALTVAIDAVCRELRDSDYKCWVNAQLQSLRSRIQKAKIVE